MLNYIDPAATSVLLSSITAIAVALGATFIVLWRKFKKKVTKVLHIDENKGKQVEEELVINEEATETATEETTTEAVTETVSENKVEETENVSKN